jgi:hypothetical protein
VVLREALALLLGGVGKGGDFRMLRCTPPPLFGNGKVSPVMFGLLEAEEVTWLWTLITSVGMGMGVQFLPNGHWRRCWKMHRRHRGTHRQQTPDIIRIHPHPPHTPQDFLPRLLTSRCTIRLPGSITAKPPEHAAISTCNTRPQSPNLSCLNWQRVSPFLHATLLARAP